MGSKGTGATSNAGSMKGKDVYVSIEIDFMDAINGC